ncbi:ABC transporter substrate-binding protein [Homoserinibacter sp. YIM 151385]|nr:ABC transporter substrate-binding protein [Homoserinibacter sp. YIM 151385]WBU39386.1 ABC transporter substrate-binding protein [Homoserinibacter sp. YIM 151385]
MAGSGDAVEAAEAGTVRLADASPLADPHDWEGPSTALLPGGGSALSVEAGEPELPATVTSHDLQGEREVEVDAAERILGIDISGSVAQTIFALGLGERVVGRDISTTIPEAAELPVVTGDGHTVEAESVIALQPDVVVTDGSIGPDDVVLQLRDVGISVVYVDPGTGLDAPAELARQVGAALGVPDAGEELARSLDEAIEAKAAEIAAVAPADPGDRLRIVFLYIRGGSGIYYLFGAESGADSLIEALGGIDIAGEQGWTGMRPMTDEALVAADPDLILVMTHGLESTGGVEGLLEAQPSVALTTAGEKRRIVDMEDGQILAFGPRTPEVLDALAVAIYAPDAR